MSTDIKNTLQLSEGNMKILLLVIQSAGFDSLKPDFNDPIFTRPGTGYATIQSARTRWSELKKKLVDAANANSGNATNGSPATPKTPKTPKTPASARKRKDDGVEGSGSNKKAKATPKGKGKKAAEVDEDDDETKQGVKEENSEGDE